LEGIKVFTKTQNFKKMVVFLKTQNTLTAMMFENMEETGIANKNPSAVKKL